LISDLTAKQIIDRFGCTVAPTSTTPTSNRASVKNWSLNILSIESRLLRRRECENRQYLNTGVDFYDSNARK
jgi:hypothetical protein